MAQIVAQAIAPYATKFFQTGLKNLALHSRPYLQRGAMAAEKSREFVRLASRAAEHPLSEEEYAVLYEEEGVELKPRAVRICYQTLRESREMAEATGNGLPLAMLSHWILEVDGVYYELRAAEAEQKSKSKKTMLYEETGAKIKLEVSTDRTMHPNTVFVDIGFTTELSDEKITAAASLIFGRFGESYDLLLDNCQHFSQLLAETICGIEKREKVQMFFDKKAFLRFPIAISWLAMPLYGTAVGINYALNDTPFANVLEKAVTGMENYYWHPRVRAGRQKQAPYLYEHGLLQ